MQGIIINHTELVGWLATLWSMVSSTAQSVLERSPFDAFRADIVDEMVTEFQEPGVALMP
jgi:hypothetical protein